MVIFICLSVISGFINFATVWITAIKQRKLPLLEVRRIKTRKTAYFIPHPTLLPEGEGTVPNH